MNIMDIVALAKAGYKPSEVKELMQLAKEEDTSTQEGVKEVIEEAKEPSEPTVSDVTSTPLKETDDNALAKKTEELQAKVELLSKQLAEAQSLNRNINNGSTEPTKNLDEQLLDLFR